MRFPVWFAAFFFSVVPATSATIKNQVVECLSATDCTILVSQPTTVTYSNTLVNGGASMTVTGFADTNIATLTEKASASYSSATPKSFYQYQAAALFQDTFAITAPGLAGTVGYLDLPFSVTGTTTSGALGQIAVDLNDPAGANTQACAAAGGCYFSGNGTVHSGPLPFHFGDSFTLFWGLGAVTFPSSGLPSATADFSHTSVLNGFVVFDSSMNPVYNATVTASGGELVPLITPEPSTLLLLVAALPFVVAVRRNRHQ